MTKELSADMIRRTFEKKKLKEFGIKIMNNGTFRLSM